MNVFDLAATLTLDTSEYSSALKNAEQQTSEIAQSAEQKASGLGSKVGGFLKVGAAAGVAAVTAAAAAVGSLVRQSVDSYAEYEQLVGGVETLFKDSADTVQQYAANAYQTAGLSANEYMETVTSFSASLLQSLGGDTAEAARIADMAIIDMSDNANKMGSDMTSIQMAYQGFAKQNYTMLDNLKLGYGGTKQEMERLIDDANKLREAQGLAADLTIDSYADVVEAIHTVQTEIGITGTTAKEASTTIQGSIGQMKSAWQNLLTGLADPNADLSKLFDNLVDSASTVVDNLLPVVEQALVSIGDLIATGIPKLFERLPEILTTVVPALISAAISLVGQLVAALPEIMAGLIEAIPTILASIMEAFGPLVESLGGLFSQAWEAVKAVFAPVGEWFTARKEDIQNAFAAVDTWFSEKFEAAKNFVHSAWESIGGWFSERWSDIQGAMQSADSWFSEKFTSAKDAVHTAWSGIGSFFTEKWTEIKNVFSDAWDIFKGIGGNIVQGLIAGIGAWIENAVNKARELVRRVIGGANSEAGINSPSKEFQIIGKYLDEGLAKGIDDNARGPINKIKDLTQQIIAIVEAMNKQVDATLTKTVNDVAYVANMDYSEAMMNAKDYDEFFELAQKRAAKIEGEGIDLEKEGWKKNSDLLKEWEEQQAKAASATSVKVIGTNVTKQTAEAEQPININTTVKLDGKAVGEAAYTYTKKKIRMVGPQVVLG